MVKYHPDSRFLTDFSAGNLPDTQALCVSTHLHFCQSCRQKVSELTALGELLFQQQASADIEDNAFNELMEKIDSLEHVRSDESIESITTVNHETSPEFMPQLLHKLSNGDLENLVWKSIGKKLRYSRLNSNSSEQETALFHIRAGGSIPHHRHKGDEITVILKGSFSDLDDQYHVGDFIVRTKGEKHAPVASQDEDCLCLSTLDAPIQMSNWFLRLLMPFINWRLA